MGKKHRKELQLGKKDRGELQFGKKDWRNYRCERRIEGFKQGEEGRGFTIGEDNEWGIEIGEVGLGDLHLRKEDWEDL